ncbi:hypothetical protein GUK30_14245 [Rhizobium leguminosarum]|uniref:hypothetical protein n=1 Tax=Rhizobium ruizarguesonis TaxID=2081791 RepID=UPI0013BF7BFC|nr:hypothetical protein [Rhizobium ruizarguesonis]NEI20571.1 hypothetical protein [Rhizobium ruizarguesonis]
MTSVSGKRTALSNGTFIGESRGDELVEARKDSFASQCLGRECEIHQRPVKIVRKLIAKVEE